MVTEFFEAAGQFTLTLKFVSFKTAKFLAKKPYSILFYILTKAMFSYSVISCVKDPMMAEKSLWFCILFFSILKTTIGPNAPLVPGLGKQGLTPEGPSVTQVTGEIAAILCASTKVLRS